ncbi:MAG: CHAT domain-containing protein, partial [Pseudomonadota bacterium]
VGNLPAARDAFAQVLTHHSASELTEQWLPPTPGQRATDALRLARLETELGDAGAAWRQLEAVGRVARTRRCPQTAIAAASDRLLEIDAVLGRLDAPASVQRKRQSAPERERLLKEQRTLLRQMRACDDAVSTAAALRAFTVDDRLVVLRRVAQQVHVAHIGPMDTRAVTDALATLDELVATRADDATWRVAAEPLAAGLSPLVDALAQSDGPAVLHGLLQRVRFAALPQEERWFADVAPPGIALPGPRRGLDAQGSTTPLFVVDPLNNLPSGDAGARRYAQLFPAARILRGADATREQVHKAVATAAFLHIDAHGQTQPGFESLSSLQMADGPVAAHRLASSADTLAFANLSGCRTALGSVTADTGQWGLAGQLIGAGVPWVIGVRDDLDDTAAAQFNAVFYEAYLESSDIAAAYHRALRALRQTQPASVWSALVLLRGSTGQVRAARTPSVQEPAGSPPQSALQRADIAGL